MKVVILAGGVGSRLAEETHLRPKPMIEIGDRPILWHIMKGYAAHGLTDFIICLGYKSHVIQDYFANYAMRQSDITIDLASDEITYHNVATDPWRVTLVQTGIDTQTGGRLRRVQPYLERDESFCMTYGDGVGPIDIGRLVAFHKRHRFEATLTAVRPPGRFGATQIANDRVTDFLEKPKVEGGYINGGFFVLEPSVISRIDDDDVMWEREPLRGLARDGKLGAFVHDGFWQPMDTLRDKQLLERLWSSGDAPWKIWD
jgi:glucose-1-phosphate cytidylyltransferase